MKKYKLEFSVGAILVAFIVLLMWQSLKLISIALPITLLSVSAVVLLFFIIPRKDASQNREVYAPKYFAQAVLSSVICMGIIVGVAVILNKNNFSKTFDLTTNKINSLSDESIKFLASLKKPIQIICVPAANPMDNYCDTNADLINLYAKNSQNIVNLGQLNLADKTMLQKVQPSGFSRLVLLTDNNKSELTNSINESAITNGIINLVRFKKVVYFLAGSGEPSIAGDQSSANYSDIVTSLQTKSYEVKEWNIKEGALPIDARVVVAGANNIAYSPQVQDTLKNFLARGGKLLLMVNPFREQGLESLYEKINLKLDPTLLVLNTTTALGQQIQKQSYSRPPVILSNFSSASAITKVITQAYGAQALMPVDGGRPITILNSDGRGSIKTTATTLMSAFSAAPISVTPEKRNKIDLSAPFNLLPDPSFDANKAWTMGVDVEITGASALAVDKSIQKPADATKDKAEVVLYGFSIVGPYSKSMPINEELLPLTVAHLYQDQELVSIPSRDLAPKQFNLSRNPGAWLPLFAGILPVLTAIAGLFIWVRRRSA